MNATSSLSRRQFLRSALTATSALALAGTWPVSLRAEQGFRPPIALFDKILHQMKLSLEDSAALVREVDFDGVDCAVRPNDRIDPARAKDDLPHYAELLRKRGRKVMLLTTAILNPTSPHARDVLETGHKLGVTAYRVAFMRWKKSTRPDKQLAELKAQLRELVALNRALGLCAMLQNHSPSGEAGYLCGDLNQMYEVVSEFPPAQLGVAFDLGHALIVHGDEWKTHFEKLKPHIRVAYIKDADRQRHFVPFGEGEFGRTDYFTRLRKMNYSAPLSVHIEYDWARGDEKNREALTRALHESLGVLRKWLAAA